MHEAIFFVVCIPTNGSNVTFNVVLWLSFLSVKFSSQRPTFSEEFLNVKYVKKVEKGFLDTAMDYKWDAAASKADLRHDFRLSATIYSLECLESEGEDPAIFIVHEVG